MPKKSHVSGNLAPEKWLALGSWHLKVVCHAAVSLETLDPTSPRRLVQEKHSVGLLSFSFFNFYNSFNPPYNHRLNASLNTMSNTGKVDCSSTKVYTMDKSNQITREPSCFYPSLILH